MLTSQSSILSKKWLDLIFDGRNKLYGAYIIRKKAPSDLTRALFAGVMLFLFMVLIPIILHHLQKGRAIEDAYDQTPVIFENIPIQRKVKEESMAMPQAAIKAKSRIDQVKMTAPKVVPYTMATDEPPTIKELAKANPGPTTITGDPTAPIAIDVVTDAVGEMASVTEGGDATAIFAVVEISPAFPGGMKAFFEYVARNYQYPIAAKEQGIKGKLILSFIVEKDGSLTDIQIVRNLGMGTGEEAVRLLQHAPKWKPGIQNGRPVRVRYQLPISLQIQ